jgi:hypothetical protein
MSTLAERRWKGRTVKAMAKAEMQRVGSLDLPTVDVTKRLRPFRASIGHYGGLYVDVPRGFLPKFKKQFPSAVFPRNIQEKNVSLEYTEQGQKRFAAKYPKSKGTVFQIYFADRAKGTQMLEDLIDKLRKKGVTDIFESGW